MVWKLSSSRSKSSILKPHSHIPGELLCADNRPAMRNVFPSPSSSRTSYCLCPVDIRLYRSGILNRPTGNAVAEYASNFLFSPFILVDHIFYSYTFIFNIFNKGSAELNRRPIDFNRFRNLKRHLKAKFTSKYTPTIQKINKHTKECKIDCNKTININYKKLSILRSDRLNLPPNSTSGDNKPPDELLLVIEIPAVSVSLVSIDGVFPIVLDYILYLHKQFTKLEPYLLKERVAVGMLMGDNRNGSSNNSAAVALISGFGSKQPACGEPSSMNGGFPVAISTIVQPKDQISA
ncbi:hypothetical protein ALC56_05821 [Trachymyrmex septentrionalis]|uniref:Uncharacterized protein n=1 Tax=Trachymyrmex septentrionalis TaxID=34720 RepID=A0A151JY48_9HYME|nr:hypothetical protein ALC56_05821 [Trachymyrmex septentrionalis]